MFYVYLAIGWGLAATAFYLLKLEISARRLAHPERAGLSRVRLNDVLGHFLVENR